MHMDKFWSLCLDTNATRILEEFSHEQRLQTLLRQSLQLSCSLPQSKSHNSHMFIKFYLHVHILHQYACFKQFHLLLVSLSKLNVQRIHPLVKQIQSFFSFSWSCVFHWSVPHHYLHSVVLLKCSTEWFCQNLKQIYIWLKCWEYLQWKIQKNYFEGWLQRSITSEFHQNIVMAFDIRTFWRLNVEIVTD